MENIEDFVQQSKRAFEIARQKQVCLESCHARQVFSYGGGIFRADPQLICYVKVLLDLDHSDSTILDSNNNPINVNLKELLLIAVQRNQEALNTYKSLCERLK